jgi:hypothetical protein
VKIYFIAFLTILEIGCFPWKTAQVPVARAWPVSTESLGSRNRDRLRTPEIVKAYPVGRYVDPTSDRVMHEKHTIYRVEEDAGWNTWNAAKGGENRPINGADSLGASAKVFQISRAHLSAMAEQNAVLEKRIRILEKEHARCLEEQENNERRKDSLKPHAIPSTPPKTSQTHHVSFRIEPLFSLDSIPSPPGSIK